MGADESRLFRGGPGGLIGAALVVLWLVALASCGEGAAPPSPSADVGGVGGAAGAGNGGAGNGGAGGGGAGGGGAAGVLPGVGLVAVPPRYDTSSVGWGQVTQAARDARVSFLSAGYLSWRDTEKTPGVHDWSEFAPLWSSLEGTPIRVTLDVASPIDFAAQLDLPPDLAFNGFDDPKLAARYRSYLASALEVVPGRLDRVTIHTEGVQEYFAEHPGERTAFCDFMEDAMLDMKARAPLVRVGAYWRYENTDVELRECLQRSTDYFALALILNPPTDSVADLPDIVEKYLAIAGTKPLALVEVGYPSSPVLGSSEAQQVTFVQSFFEVLKLHRDRLEMVSYYTAFDEDREIMEFIADTLFGTEPSEPRTLFVEWSSSLGLRSVDGAPKAAWPAFLAGAAASSSP